MESIIDKQTLDLLIQLFFDARTDIELKIFCEWYFKVGNNMIRLGEQKKGFGLSTAYNTIRPNDLRSQLTGKSIMEIKKSIENSNIGLNGTIRSLQYRDKIISLLNDRITEIRMNGITVITKELLEENSRNKETIIQIINNLNTTISNLNSANIVIHNLMNENFYLKESINQINDRITVLVDALDAKTV